MILINSSAQIYILIIMKKRKLVLLSCLLLFVFSSQSGESQFNQKNDFGKTIENMKKKVITFPDSLSVNAALNNDAVKIISVVTACSYKSVDELNYWRPIINELKTTNDSEKLVFIIEGIAPDYFKRTFSNKIPSNLNIVFDPECSFSNSNKLPNIKMLKTFMIDENNRILIVGNPVHSKNIWMLYSNEFEEDRFRDDMP